VILGIYSLIKSGFKNISGPITMIIIFGIIQLLVLGILSWSVIGNWWPLIIILIGAGIIFNHYRQPSTNIDSRDKIDVMAMLGGVDNNIKSNDFKGGEITVLMGGVELDLRDSKIGDQPAVINATVIMGGVDLKVPADWNIDIKMIPILGGVDDERRRSSDENQKDKPDLVLNGFVALGGLSIKD
jgi:predicted membrane protein